MRNPIDDTVLLTTVEDRPHLLVIDDDERLLKLIKTFLMKSGYRVTTSVGTSGAWQLLNTLEVDLIVVDVMMPHETGIEFTQKFRLTYSTPILMLTAKSETADRIEGLRAGADDYLTKPFEPEELLLRVRSILRRSFQHQKKIAPDKKAIFGCFCYDIEGHKLFKNGEIQYLTTAENDLLYALIVIGRVVDRETLAQKLNLAVGDRTVDVQINRLRKKIETDPKTPQYLLTIRGKGYWLRLD